MRLHIKYLAIGLVALFCAATTSVADDFGPLKGVTYGSGSKAIVVVLHGDVSRGGPADYHYNFAKTAARKNKGITAIGLLRPGYSDRKGQKSSGSHNGRSDHYTKRNNDLVAQSLKSIKAKYVGSKIVVVAHSGGAAQIGVILGRYPRLVDSAILVACPCNIGAWRNARNASAWKNSQSPHSYLKSVPKSTRINVVNGSRDRNTRPAQAKNYVASAQKRGLSVTYTEVNGAEHGFNRMASKLAKIVMSETK